MSLRGMVRGLAHKLEDTHSVINSQATRIGELSDPTRQFEFMQQTALEPAFQAIIGNRLSAAQIRRMRAYKLSDEVMASLVRHDVLPQRWPDPTIFGPAAFRRYLPREQQLPMPKLQRELLESEVLYPILFWFGGWGWVGAPVGNFPYYSVFPVFRLSAVASKPTAGPSPHRAPLVGRPQETRTYSRINVVLIK